MGANLYFMSGDRAISMSEHRYEHESILQKIIADNPNLLLRDTDPDGSRLMLVDREFDMAEGDDSYASYYLDHLLVDQSGMPVLVEVKKSSNPQARREVVAQMLDYASRASTWDVDDLRQRFKQNNYGSEILDAYDTDEFWMQVANCLKAERVKLVFAADRIPSTLRTLIGFMDRNMDGIEVYGVELRRYKADGVTMLTSNVAGETLLKSRRVVTRNVEWNAANFAAFLLAKGRKDAIPICDDIRAYAESIGLICVNKSGTKYPTFYTMAGKVWVFTVGFWWKGGKPWCTFEINILHIANYLGGEWTKDAIKNLLTDIPNKNKRYAEKLIWKTAKHLYIDLRALSEDEDMAYFKDALRKLAEAVAERQEAEQAVQ